jgi:hypothetical protein
MPRINSTPKAISWSARKKKIAARKAKPRTIAVEIIVSRREGQVTLAVSDLTCWRKVKGLVVFDAILPLVFESAGVRNFQSARYRDLLSQDLKHVARIGASVPGMQFGRVKPDLQLHAPRVCRFYIKPILYQCKAQESAFCMNTGPEPSYRPVPAISLTAHPWRVIPNRRPAQAKSCGPFGKDHATTEGNWQGQRGSNPRPAVLETAALPTELYPYGCHCAAARFLRTSAAYVKSALRFRQGQFVSDRAPRPSGNCRAWSRSCRCRPRRQSSPPRCW